MSDLYGPEASKRVRTALKAADAKGKLSVVAAVAGISGGESKLRELMNSDGEIDMMTCAQLSTHLA